ncbi:MAG: TonB-dependent receptor [Saprospiraceae bacterium]|nr:TonB-dependent receptor [Saprospiraceae bacterium]
MATINAPNSAEMRVSGKVTDQAGEGLYGVTVKVKGTTSGTVTDLDGNYAVSVNDGSAVLVFSFTGYSSKEETVGSRSVIDVVLSEGISLDQVVVVGYGTQRKVDLTGAVGSVTSKDLEAKPVTSTDQILAGRISGVHIANRSGNPGSPIEVRIRGIGTAGTNQPLWVIDGVPIVTSTSVTVNTSSSTEGNPLSAINPNDIESIDVLKDASASAIYGARANNGVILVTTKRGKEGKPQLVYDGFSGIQSVPESRRFDMLNTADYIKLQNELGKDLSSFSGKGDVDWQDQIFRKASINSHNLGISGGTANATYSIGAGYLNQKGVELAQDFNRYSLRAASDLKAGQYFKFGESLILSTSDRHVQSEDAALAAFNAAKNAPYFQPFDARGEYNPANATTAGAGRAVNYAWLLDFDAQETRVKHKKALASVYGEFEPIKNLKYRANLGYDYNIVEGFYFEEALDYSGGSTPQQSLVVQERPLETTFSLGHTLSYAINTGNHNLTALVGYEQTDYRFERIRVQGTGLKYPGIKLAATANTVSSGANADQWAIRGILGRINYTFADKYLLTVNARQDESSRFAEGNRKGFFPSFSLGWRAGEEQFLRNADLFSNLKFRLSWGETGNQFTGTNFAYLPSLGSYIYYASGNAIKAAAAPEFLANPNVRWETATQTDFGVDFGLMDDHLVGTIDYFNKKTSDLLLQAPVPLSTGFFGLVDVNAGEMKNSGVELDLQYRNRKGNFSYGIAMNATFVNNEILSLPTGVDYISNGDGNKRISVGESLGYFYGFKTDGLYQSDSEVPTGEGFAGAEAGDVKFVDVNGDGKLNDMDRTNLGGAIPTRYYGATFSAGFKGFDVSVFLQGVGGHNIYNDARRQLEGMNTAENQLATVNNRWTSSNTNTDIPRAGNNHDNNRFSDRWIEKGDFMRIRNLQIGYNLPAKFAKNTIAGARVYVAVQNLATFTKYTGYDPEVTRPIGFTNGENQLINGIDSGGTPQPLVVQFGWQVRL